MKYLQAETRCDVNEIFSGSKPRPRHQGRDITALMMGTESVPETSAIFNHLTRYIAREDCINVSRR